MKIELVRHFKVDYEFKKYYSSAELTYACGKYDTSVVNTTFKILNTHGKIYTSALIRTHITAEYLTNKKEIIKESLLNEIELSPFFKTKIKLPLKFWVFMRNFCWKFNIPLVKETKRDTMHSVNLILDLIERNNENITLVGHAVFFSVLLKELKRRKYTGKYKPNFFNNGELREFEK